MNNNLKNKITECVFTSIDEINSQLDGAHQIKKSESTILFGEGSTLESIHVVNLLMQIEHSIQKNINSDLVIIDADALDPETSPLRTVSGIITMIEKKMDELDV